MTDFEINETRPAKPSLVSVITRKFMGNGSDLATMSDTQALLEYGEYNLPPEMKLATLKS
ncbi:MAG TPA: hypothetical protein VGF14_01265 [Alphaproteobacteria bacterium]